MSLGEVDAAEALVERRETDLAGLDRELAREVVENLVSVEVAPDGFAVLERCVRVPADGPFDLNAPIGGAENAAFSS